MKNVYGQQTVSFPNVSRQMYTLLHIELARKPYLQLRAADTRIVNGSTLPHLTSRSLLFLEIHIEKLRPEAYVSTRLSQALHTYITLYFTVIIYNESKWRK